jgi:hypothetical protein
MTELRKLSDPLKRGTYVIFYGSEENKPCGCQFVSKDDLGNKVWADFEVFACSDVGIRTSIYGTTVPGITAEELIENLKECFKRCGCKM